MAQQSIRKSDLVALLAEKAGVSAREAGDVLDALSETIIETVAAGDALTIPGVGKLSARDREARSFRNPRTGETVQKAANRVPRMTFSKTIKDACGS